MRRRMRLQNDEGKSLLAIAHGTVCTDHLGPGELTLMDSRVISGALQASSTSLNIFSSLDTHLHINVGQRPLLSAIRYTAVV